MLRGRGNRIQGKLGVCLCMYVCVCVLQIQVVNTVDKTGFIRRQYLLPVAITPQVSFTLNMVLALTVTTIIIAILTTITIIVLTIIAITTVVTIDYVQLSLDSADSKSSLSASFSTQYPSQARMEQILILIGSAGSDSSSMSALYSPPCPPFDVLPNEHHPTPNTYLLTPHLPHCRLRDNSLPVSYVNVCMYVCVHVCMYACMHACVDPSLTFAQHYLLLQPQPPPKRSPNPTRSVTPTPKTNFLHA